MNTTLSYRAPIHQALTSPILIAGAERELTIGISFLAAIIWVAGKDILSIVLSLVIWLLGNAVFRHCAKQDKELSKIYLRHIRYQSFYPASEKLRSPLSSSPTKRGVK